MLREVGVLLKLDHYSITESSRKLVIDRAILDPHPPGMAQTLEKKENMINTCTIKT